MPNTDIDLTPGGSNPLSQAAAFYRIYAAIMYVEDAEVRAEAAREMVAYSRRIDAAIAKGAA